MWMTSLTLVERTIATVSTLILVRLLSPEDFGIVAMAMVIVQGLELLTAFGFDIVLIQNQQAERRHYDSAWTLKVGFGTISAALLVAVIPLAVEFYNSELLAPVLSMLAIGFFVRSFENIAIVDFRKYMQFHKDVYLRLAVKITGFVVTIPAAFILQSYWALVIGVLVTNIATVVYSYVAAPYMPRFSVSATREIFRFSSWLILNNFLAFLRTKIPDLVIGRVLGSSSLGAYTVSLEVSTVATSGIGAAINRAIFPGYAQISRDLASLVSTIADITAAMAIIAVPIGLGVVVTAELFVPILLGPDWLGTIPVIHWLAIYGAIGACTSHWMYVYNALAKPHLVTQISLFQLIVVASLLYWLIPRSGIEGAAASLTLAAAATVPLMMLLLHRETGLSPWSILRVVARPIIAGTVMYFTTHAFISINNGPGASAPLLLVGAIGVGGVSYPLVLGLLWYFSGKPAGAEATVWQMAAGRFSRTSG